MCDVQCVLLLSGLYVMNIDSSGQVTWCTLQGSAPAAVPHVLTYIPHQSAGSSQVITSPTTNSSSSTALGTPDDMQVDIQSPPAAAGSHLAGLLFIGSRSSSSQVLGLPHSILAAAQAEQQQQGCVPLVCPMFQSSFMPSLAGAQSVVVIKDPTGE